MSQLYKIGIYMRLSCADGDDESESISNQRKIIESYIENNIEYETCYEYVDDGYSGSNFNRPGFQRLLLDISMQKINLIITKSLSRFGRNYINCGEYIEKIFPENNIRYIAILDNIDTLKDSYSNDFLPIKGILNELYCRETSKNLKESKKRNRKDGLYTSTTPLYGYKKDPNTFGKILINEETAPIVKKIFDMSSQGFNRREIAEYLNQNKIKTPSQYANFKRQSNYWTNSIVGRILENENYTGKCISGKTVKLNFKSQKRVCIPRSERLCVENTHEAIISQELFDSCHNNKYGTTRIKRNPIFKLRKFLYCGECNRMLCYSLMRYDKYSFKCHGNIDSIRKCSNNGRYSYHKIEKIIFDVINEIIAQYYNKIDKNKILNRTISEKKRSAQNRMKTKEKELNNIMNDIRDIYGKRLSGVILESEYIKIFNQLNQRKKEKQLEIDNLKELLNDFIDVKTNDKQVKNIIKMIKNKGVENFSEDELSMFIDKIYFNKNEIIINFKMNFNQKNQKKVTYKK